MVVHIKGFLKTIPGAVPAVNSIRKLVKRTLVWANKMLEALASASPEWRDAQFDAKGHGLVLTNHREENYVVSSRDKVIGKILHCRGDFELTKLLKALRILSAHEIFEFGSRTTTLIDVGANVGSVCIPAIKRNLVGRCIAIEPDEQNFKLLRINSILNEVDTSIEAYQVALGEKCGVARLTRSETNHGDHRVGEVTDDSALTAEGIAREDASVIRVETLDTLLGNFDYGEAILWLDVQGYEGLVLMSSKAALRDKTPIVFEFTPEDLIRSGTLEPLVELLVGSGYELWADLSLESGPTRFKRSSLRDLASTLGDDGAFTDVLVF
jgi:FkbM family methyltransferase